MRICDTPSTVMRHKATVTHETTAIDQLAKMSNQDLALRRAILQSTNQDHPEAVRSASHLSIFFFHVWQS